MHVVQPYVSSVPLPQAADVIVVGAGLAGLGAASELARAGRSVIIVEASDGVGGRVRSDEVDGFTLDRGFQILLTAYPEAIRQLDYAALDLKAFDAGALVWLDGRGHYIGDPLRDPSSLLSTAVSPIGSIADKARILQLRQRVLSAEPRELLSAKESATSNHLRNLGFSTKMVERFFRPLFAGIQLDPDLATSSRMFDIIFRSLSEGDSVVPAAGMGAITEQLASRLPDATVFLDTPVTAVTAGAIPTVTTARGSLTASDVIVAVDGPAACNLLGLDPVGSQAAGCVWFGAPTSPFDRAAITLDGTGVGPALNVAVLSDVAPSYAPDGQALIAAACPNDIGPDLEERVRQQLAGWFGPTVVAAWTTLRVDRIAHGQPQQQPPFSPKQSVRHAENIWVCGDHRDTGSIQGALYSGRRTAEAVLADR